MFVKARAKDSSVSIKNLTTFPKMNYKKFGHFNDATALTFL